MKPYFIEIKQTKFTILFCKSIYLILAFKAFNSKEDDFLTSHQTRDKLGDIFRRCAEKVFSGRDKPPFSAPAVLQENLEELAGLFCSLGVVYSSVPLSTEVTVSAAIIRMINILRPYVTLAQNPPATQRSFRRTTRRLC
jgi:hypothetical protein